MILGCFWDGFYIVVDGENILFVYDVFFSINNSNKFTISAEGKRSVCGYKTV